MTSAYSDAVNLARDYYNSEDADNFYFHIWGGEDIHIGLYDDPQDVLTQSAVVQDAVAIASRRTTTLIAERLGEINPVARILDMGSGYGGSSRYLARQFGCRITALNLSERENARNRVATAHARLAHLVEVVDGSFEDMPFADATFDIVWSIDAMLHSSRRDRVFREVYRVLRPGGQFIYTDPMESGRCAPAQLAPVLARIHLESMGSFAGDAALAAKAGLTLHATTDLTPHLIAHYARIKQELEAKAPSLAGKVSPAFIANALTGLDHWVTAGNAGCLAWGIQHYKKPDKRPS